MERILVIGGNGSGKTTFSLALAERLQLPLVHLDQLYWAEDWQPAPREEFDRRLRQALEQPAWILDGNMNRTIPLRLCYCDTVFYFDFSTIRCLWGVTHRVLKNYGKTRPDMGRNCPERFDLSFYRAILSFNRQHRKQYHALLAQQTGKTVVIFKNRRQVARYLASLPSPQ